MKEYIVESARLAQKMRKEYLLFGHVVVQVTDALPSNIDLKFVLSELESKIPRNLLEDLDSVYIGSYKPLQDRQIDSLYVEGSILITNNQPSNVELYSTFVHEFAHAIEEKYKDTIYSDGQLAREFLAKRNTLYNLLKDDYDLNKKAFIDINYNQEFDDFAYKTVGYENLGIMTSGLFISPYGCTSLREYFANGFEHYFLKQTDELREKSPYLFKKIKHLINKN